MVSAKNSVLANGSYISQWQNSVNTHRLLPPHHLLFPGFLWTIGDGWHFYPYFSKLIKHTIIYLYVIQLCKQNKYAL